VEVFISHYKSIEKAQMKLGRVTVLLGPPAAGKSSVLEAIALATYFDRYAFYDKREPLSKLVRTDDVSDLFTFYDLTKAVEISVGTDEWRRSLRIYFQKGLRLELNDAEVSIEGYPQVFDRSLYLFSYSGHEYRVNPYEIKKLPDTLGEKIVARLYGFDRFKDDIINSMIKGAGVEPPQGLLREDGKNFGLVAKKQPEVISDINAELAELSRVEVKLLEDGRVVVFDNNIAMKPSAISDSVFRILYNSCRSLFGDLLHKAPRPRGENSRTVRRAGGAAVPPVFQPPGEIRRKVQRSGICGNYNTQPNPGLSAEG
jgi:hypothetical protein